jgi:transposase
MMNKVTEKQNRLMYINLDDYVPQVHLLRAIRKAIDFGFIYDKVRPLYSDVGRASIDPVLPIKMLLLGYLYGIPSERKLEEEVRLNLAYRWFLGLDLEDKVPDHSTFSQNRRRRFKQSGIFQEVFDHIVTVCVSKGLVTGEVIVTDSTHIKANASMERTWGIKSKVVGSIFPNHFCQQLQTRGVLFRTLFPLYNRHQLCANLQ